MANSFTVHCPIYSKKNSKRCFGNKVVQSARSKLGDNLIAKDIFKREEEWFAFLGNAKPPFKLHFYIYRETKARFDYINIIQGLLDVFVKCKFLQDDDMNFVNPSFDWEKDKDNPRVVITKRR